MTETQPKITLKIYYMNGNHESFEFFPNPDVSKLNTVSRIHKILDSQQIILELPDQVVVIPMSSIQKIEISPVPEKLPDNAIRDVRAI
jgi:hypothetical protein